MNSNVEGGPDFPQMEPTDQLDAPNRRLPEPRKIPLANPSLFTTSPIQRLGCRWLFETRFWSARDNRGDSVAKDGMSPLRTPSVRRH